MRAEWIRVCYWCQPTEWWMTLMQVQIQVIRSLCYYWFLNLLQSGCDYPHDDVKWSHYKPNVAQRVGRGIALLFHYHGTRRGWVVSSTTRPHFTTGKDSVPIVQEAGWAPGLVWAGGKSRPHQDSIQDRAACSQLLYWLSYPAHLMTTMSEPKYVNSFIYT